MLQFLGTGDGICSVCRQSLVLPSVLVEFDDCEGAFPAGTLLLGKDI
jgi:hypothetical protein